MHIKSWWIPKSDRGHKVAQYLREQGFDVTNEQVIGHYVGSVPCINETHVEQRRRIAFLLKPELAAALEIEALLRADDFKKHPEQFLLPECNVGMDDAVEMAQNMAKNALMDWLM